MRGTGEMWKNERVQLWWGEAVRTTAGTGSTLMFLLRTFIVLSLLLGTSTLHAEEKKSEGSKGQWGIGVTYRAWRVSKRLQEQFMEESAGPASGRGVGFDFSRRNKDIEFSFGFGYDDLNGQDGYYVDNGGDPTVVGDTDYNTFHKLKWYTAEITVVGHASIHKFLEFRFGAGIGAGLIRGKMRKTDAICSTYSVPQSCMIDPNAVDVDEPASIPPVLPVINMLVGVQLTPFKWLHLHLDAGIHSTPYIGGGMSLYLW